MEKLIDNFHVLNILNEETKLTIKLLYIFRNNTIDNSKEINVIFVTNSDKVYCFGGNSYGVLGFGHKTAVNEFTINEELSNKKIIEFQNGVYHTLARTSDGKLYCCGFNGCGSLGNGPEDLKINKPQLNKHLINENIIAFCCGNNHTLVLTLRKEVYAWGGNDWGQIGNKDYGTTVPIPFKINAFNGEKVKAISCGLSHSMALTESGCVYSWGYNNRGQLGINNGNKYEKSPKRIHIRVKFKEINCGSRHSLLLSLEGDIYVFGWNKYNQLGLSTNEENQLSPIKLNNSVKFKEIASHSQFHISAALSYNGFYHIWGNYKEGLVIREPKITQFKSFNEILVHYFEITYKTLEIQVKSQNELTNNSSISKGLSLKKAVNKQRIEFYYIPIDIMFGTFRFNVRELVFTSNYVKFINKIEVNEIESNEFEKELLFELNQVISISYCSQSSKTSLFIKTKESVDQRIQDFLNLAYNCPNKMKYDANSSDNRENYIIIILNDEFQKLFIQFLHNISTIDGLNMNLQEMSPEKAEYLFDCAITKNLLIEKEIKLEEMKKDFNKLRSVCDSFKRKCEILEENDFFCPVCLEKKNKILLNGIKMVSTLCGHVFCKICLDNVLKARKVCPNCVKPLNEKEAYLELHI